MLIRHFSIALFSLAAAAFADTVILKSGEKVAGKILSETEAEVVIEVTVGGGIKDERKIKRAEVDKVEKVMPDEQEWARIKGMAIGEDSLESADYQRAATILQAFVTDFPKSTHVAEAKDKLAKFEEEKKRVDAGEVKQAGTWLTVDQVKVERIQIIGGKLLRAMKRHFAAGQLVEAMNAFDALEKSAPGCAAYPEAVDLARRALPALQAACEQTKGQIFARTEDGKRRLENAQGNEKLQLETLLKQDAARTLAAVTSYEKSGVKWLPLSPATEKSLSTQINKIGSAITTLNRLQTANMRDSILIATKAKAALEAGKVDETLKFITEARNAWAENEMVKRLEPKLADAQKAAIEAKAAEERAAMAAAAKATPTPKPAPKPEEKAEEAAAEEPVKREEGSILGKPAFWVILLIVLGAAGLVMKFFGKFKDPSKNLLDQ